MGREALCACRVGKESGDVKALLESTELILRGAIKRRYEISSLSGAAVVAGELHFKVGTEAVALVLGEADSQRWLKKINTPPPSLAEKLGLSGTNKALVFGKPGDAALVEALRGAQTKTAGAAALLVAVVRSEAELMAMIELHRTMSAATVWVVYPKGRAASISDGTIRQTLRTLGYVDNKTSAVSDVLTATRYVKR
jgi:hypothetical protein